MAPEGDRRAHLRLALKGGPMRAVFDYILANKEWIFSGVGVLVLGLVLTKLLSGKANATPIPVVPPSVPQPSLDEWATAKARTRILFIDDDTTFAVVRILKQAGWMHTKIVKDIRSLDDSDVQAADIFFVDIQGVGKALKFSDQGLGLARALKQKYPSKWLVIYSAEPKSDTFHQGFRLADDRIAKTADPYEFQTIVENFVIGHQ